MTIETKNNYTISKPEEGIKITGTEIIMTSIYCEDDRGRNGITAVELYPEIKDDNQYYLEYYGNPPKWAIDWFKKYLKNENIPVII